MESTHLPHAQSDHDAHRPEAGVATADAREDVATPAGTLVGSSLAGAPGKPPGEGVTHLLRSPALAHASNDGLRAVAIQRAQRTHGNRYVQRLVAGLGRSPSGVVQRQCSCGGTCAKCQAEAAAKSPGPDPEEEPKLVQAQSSGGSTEALRADEVIPQGEGSPLDDGTRRHMESRFGTDLGGVRVHTDDRAATSARSIGADAFATGRDIYFAPGKYAPERTEGQHLLAHEVAHTIQQSDGAAPREPAARRSDEAVVIGEPDDPLEKEAERAADRVVASDPATDAAAPLSRGGPGVSRTIRRQPAGTEDAPASVPQPTPPVPTPAPPTPTPDQTPPAPVKAPEAPPAPAPRSVPDAPQISTAPAPAKDAPPAPDAPAAAPAPPSADGTPGPAPASKAPSVAAKAGVGPPVPAMAGPTVDAAGNEALARFLEQADIQRTALLASAEAEKKKIADAAAALKTSVQSGVESEAVRLDGLYQDAIDQVQEAADEARDAIESDRDDRIQSIETTAKADSETLTRTVGEKQAALRSGADERATAALKFGDEQAKRATDASRKKADQAKEVGARKIQEHRNYDRAARIARVIQEMTDDGAKTLIQSGNELAEVARSDARDLAGKFRDEAAEAADKFGDSLDEGLAKIAKERESAIDGLTKAAADPVAQLAANARNLVVQLTMTRAAAVGEVRQLTSAILAGIDASARATSDRIDSEAASAVRGLDSSVALVSQRLGKARGRAAEAKLREGESVLASSCAKFQASLGGLAGDSQRAIEDGATESLRRVTDQVDRLGDPLAKVATDFVATAEKTSGEVSASMEKLAAESLKGMDDAVADVDRELQSGLDQSLKQWDTELAQGTDQIRQKVDEGVAQYDEILQELGRSIDEKADEIEDESWFDRAVGWVAGVFVGLLEGVWEAIKGLLLIALIVLAAIVVVALVIALLIALGASLEVILAVLAVVATIAEVAMAIAEVAAVVFIIYGVVSGISSIVMSFSRDDLSDYERGKLAGKGTFDVVFSIFGEEILAEVGGWAKGLVGLEETGAEGRALGGKGGPGVDEGALDAPKPGEPIEKPTAGEPGEPLSDEAAAKAEKEGIPREELEAEVGELEQKARNPENVRKPKDPRFDAEMDADGHTFDRDESSKTWCRFSDPLCDLDLGNDVNSEVDAALEDKPAETSSGEPKPGEGDIAPKSIADPQARVRSLEENYERILEKDPELKSKVDLLKDDLADPATAESAAKRLPELEDELIDAGMEELSKRHSIDPAKEAELRNFLREHPEQLADALESAAEEDRFGQPAGPDEAAPTRPENTKGGSKPTELGNEGKDLSRRDAREVFKEEWVADELEFRAQLPNGTEVTFRADIGTIGPGGEARLVEAKFGPEADLTIPQSVGYPTVANRGAVPANTAAETFARRSFPGWQPGQPTPPIRVRIDRWLGGVRSSRWFP